MVVIFDYHDGDSGDTGVDFGLEIVRSKNLTLYFYRVCRKWAGLGQKHARRKLRRFLKTGQVEIGDHLLSKHPTHSAGYELIFADPLQGVQAYYSTKLQKLQHHLGKVNEILAARSVQCMVVKWTKRRPKVVFDDELTDDLPLGKFFQRN